MNTDIDITAIVAEETEEVNKNLVDKITSTAIFTLPGAFLDYFVAGFTMPFSVLTLRGLNGVANYKLGAAWEKWREMWHRIFKARRDNYVRRYLAEVTSFNTIQTEIYGATMAIASLIEKGYIDLEKVANGSCKLAIASLVTAPLAGSGMDIVRKFFGLKPASEAAYSE